MHFFKLVIIVDKFVYSFYHFIVAAFNLDFYTDVQDLSYLQNSLDKDPHSAKYRYALLCGNSLPTDASKCNSFSVCDSNVVFCTR